MIYLDNGATSLHKPVVVADAVRRAMFTCANPGRGGYPASMAASRTVLRCRQKAAQLFHCLPEQVVFTANCTQGLNTAIHSLIKPGSRVLITGFEHNAVTRPLHAAGAEIIVAGQRLFDQADTLSCFEDSLKKGVSAAVFTHCSNVFGYILPVEEMAALCRHYGVPFIIDAAQSAGMLPIEFDTLGAYCIAMPGHKGLLGPQGTGILLCDHMITPLLQGGTGSLSVQQEMPDFLPDGLEAGTLNVPGIAGLEAGISYVLRTGPENIGRREQKEAKHCAKLLQNLGLQVFAGTNQSGTVSFVPPMDCEELATALGEQGIAVRAGLHCAPLAHKSAGTLHTGTVRVSYGHDASEGQTQALIMGLKKIIKS